MFSIFTQSYGFCLWSSDEHHQGSVCSCVGCARLLCSANDDGRASAFTCEAADPGLPTDSGEEAAFKSLGEQLHQEGHTFRASQHRFHRSALACILTSRFYIGELHRHGQAYQGRYERLIEPHSTSAGTFFRGETVTRGILSSRWPADSSPVPSADNR
jgi:hypothetical protein